MTWKNLKQRRLAESMLIEHKVLKESDAVYELMAWSRIETLPLGIHAKSKGEKAWPSSTTVTIEMVQVKSNVKAKVVHELCA